MITSHKKWKIVWCDIRCCNPHACPPASYTFERRFAISFDDPFVPASILSWASRDSDEFWSKETEPFRAERAPYSRKTWRPGIRLSTTCSYFRTVHSSAQSAHYSASARELPRFTFPYSFTSLPKRRSRWGRYWPYIIHMRRPFCLLTTRFDLRVSCGVHMVDIYLNKSFSSAKKWRELGKRRQEVLASVVDSAELFSEGLHRFLRSAFIKPQRFSGGSAQNQSWYRGSFKKIARRRLKA